MSESQQGARIGLSSPKTTRALTRLLRSALMLFRATAAIAAYEHKDRLKWHVLYPLCSTLADSCNSLVLLARAGQMRDALILIRAISETMINILYIHAGGDETAGQAMRHAIQKSARAADREVRFQKEHLDRELELPIDFRSIPQIQDALNEYTTRKGWENTKWTADSPAKRVERIAAAYGQEHAAIFTILLDSFHQEASELAHGTFYGAMYSWGRASLTSAPTGNDAEIRSKNQSRISTGILQVGLALCVVTKLLCRAQGIKHDDVTNIADEMANLAKSEIAKAKEAGSLGQEKEEKPPTQEESIP